MNLGMDAQLSAALAQIGLAAREGRAEDASAQDILNDAQIRQIARSLNISVREAMIRLSRAGIWPLRFLRNRNILTSGQQAKLLDLKIYVAGCGGLGGYVLALLTRMGAARFRICDPDVFEESNLNRQNFCTEQTIGLPKVEAVKSALLQVASYIEVEALQAEADQDTLPAQLQEMDIAIDCLDSVARKKMLEQAAAQAGIAYLHGAVLGQDGFVFLDRPGKNRLQILYPDVEGGNFTPGSNNVLATTVCGAAVLMASLLVKNLAGGRHDALLHADFSIPILENLSL